MLRIFFNTRSKVAARTKNKQTGSDQHQTVRTAPTTNKKRKSNQPTQRSAKKGKEQKKKKKLTRRKPHFSSHWPRARPGVAAPPARSGHRMLLPPLYRNAAAAALASLGLLISPPKWDEEQVSPRLGFASGIYVVGRSVARRGSGFGYVRPVCMCGLIRCFCFATQV